MIKRLLPWQSARDTLSNPTTFYWKWWGILLLVSFDEGCGYNDNNNYAIIVIIVIGWMASDILQEGFLQPFLEDLQHSVSFIYIPDASIHLYCSSHNLFPSLESELLLSTYTHVIHILIHIPMNILIYTPAYMHVCTHMLACIHQQTHAQN